MNSTLSNSECKFKILLTDTYSLIMNSLKIILFVLYLTWIVMAIKVKEFHCKNMAFLFNLNIISLCYAAYSVIFLLIPTCLISFTYCIIQYAGGFFFPLTPAYSLCALVVYRLACVTYHDLEKKLTKKAIIFTIGLTWFIPALAAVSTYFIFDLKSEYIESLKVCASHTKEVAFGYVVVAVIGVPSIVVSIVYLIAVIKLKFKKKRINSSQSARIPRITIMLLIYIVIFHISNAAAIVQFYENTYNSKINETVSWISRIMKIFQHFCPISLLYSNPIITKHLKSIFEKYARCLKILPSRN